jgi:hypothetical protein
MNSKNTGQFLPTPPGQKTPKMREVEVRLGRTLEDDFREYYTDKGLGQKRLANRWGVQRNLIFGTNLRGARRSWATMLNLDVRRLNAESASGVSPSQSKLTCEICNAFETFLDGAHWISNRDGGGTQSYNILRLCPNCHRKLDRDDPTTTILAMETLLFREAKRIVETGRDTKAKRHELARVCEAIISRRIN